PHLLSQPVTSPFLSFVTWKKKSPFGIMITASHNPSQYLGFKIKGSFGGSIAPETVSKIEEKLHSLTTNGSASLSLSVPARPSQTSDSPLFLSYLQYLKEHVDVSLFQKKKIKIVFDTLYGSGSYLSELFFRSFSHPLEIEPLHQGSDPLFGGLHPEPIEEYLGDLKNRIRQSHADVGFALDGDGDRLGIVDESGTYRTPQQVFALLLYYLLTEKKLKGKVVQAVSLGFLSERIASDYNCPLEEVPVGFKSIAEKMLAEPVLIGGEESGGYAFSKTKQSTRPGSIIPERDGLFSSLLILEMMAATGRSVGQILKEVQKRYGNSFYLRKDIPLSRPIPNKSAFTQEMQKRFPDKWLGLSVREMRTLDGLKIVLSDGSWVLLRPSGTEPLLRTYAEFSSLDLARKSLEKLAALIPASIGR
ncbi:MAG: hypothetical protein HYY07_05480, partial [Elusimicrobia bacterium]|nr:hypothetical protein [Elusimicrobiota bacterium]